MSKIFERIEKSKLYSYIVMILIFLFWLLSFLSVNGKLNESVLNKCEWISMILIGISFIIIAIFNKTCDLMVPIIMYTPFIFAHPFYVINMPYALFIGIGCLVLGLILHQIIHRPKFNLGKNFIGIALLALAMTFGGIAIKTDYSKMQFFGCLGMGGAILFLYYCLSNNKFDFNKVSHIVNALGILLVLQVVTYYIINDDTVGSIFTKCVDVGWGIENNSSLILLLTMPFTLYLSITNKNFKQLGFSIIFILQFLAILFSYSRGATAAMALGLLIMIPVCAFLTKDKKTYLITLISFTVILFVFFQVLYLKYHDYYERFIEYALKVNMGNYNGRKPIYEEVIANYKLHPLFGSGMFSPFYDILEEGVGEYQWGHSTLLHTILTMGTFGLLALLYHFFEKYFYLVKKMNKEKFLVLMGFLLSGLYGMIDVSYYFINYMIVLIVILAIIENTISNKVVDDGVL